MIVSLQRKIKNRSAAFIPLGYRTRFDLPHRHRQMFVQAYDATHMNRMFSSPPLLEMRFKIRTVIVLLLVIVASHNLSARAQTEPFVQLENLKVEKGHVSELDGPKRVYIFTKLSKADNEEFRTLVERTSPLFIIVDSFEGADLIISFAVTGTQTTQSSISGKDRDLSRRESNYTLKKYKGRGVVFSRKDRSTIRIYFDFDRRSGTEYYHAPWKTFVKEFGKSLKRNR